MLDGQNRTIDYLRISVTDRCDLRCVYCMPEEGVKPLCHEKLLTYEEIVRLCRIFASLGVHRMRLTGGEPLARLGVADLARQIKAIDGVDRLDMTTNGMQLSAALPALAEAGLDSVNISLDTTDEAIFERITRRKGVDKVLRAIDDACATPNLTVKINTVPSDLNAASFCDMAELSARKGIPVRFIELMPIGEGGRLDRWDEERVRGVLEAKFGPMTRKLPVDPMEKCRYFTLPNGAAIGFISAVSHKFCATCDRIRLTAEGYLKTCLQYDTGVELKPLLDRSDEELREIIAQAVRQKPLGHHFGQMNEGQDETRRMSQIGG